MTFQIRSFRDDALLFISLFLCIFSSYIHPDEHFQSLEVLANKFLHYTASFPWEFRADLAARSYGPLYLVYGPIFGLAKLISTNINITPIYFWQLVKAQNLIVSWFVLKYGIRKLGEIKAISFASYFIFTSYITIIFQAHTFSNTVETWAVIISLCLINDLQGFLHRNMNFSLFLLGMTIGFGTFNRITFPAFVFLPLCFNLKVFLKRRERIFVLALGFLIVSLIFIYIDTLQYNGPDIEYFNLNSYVITPLNNLLYNSLYKNLSEHGIHPHYTHLLINLPQILGPSILFIITGVKKINCLSLSCLSMLGALIILSIFPHQELRFLSPTVPLFFLSLTLEKGLQNSSQNYTKIILRLISKGWIFFNIIMCVLMGILHQGGIIPVINHLRNVLILNKNSVSSVQVWWRTYPPPLWLFGDTRGALKTIHDLEELEEVSSSSNLHLILDCMGSDYSKLLEALNRANQLDVPVYLITPKASFLTLNLIEAFDIDNTWTFPFHIDLDHLEISDINSFSLGLAIYELL